tara:strand:- start:124 stop:330 length:207 start_codon:yes stop_codon:yes gene_type:complete
MGYERELEKEKFICKLNRLNAFDLIIEEAYLEDREEEFTFTGEYDKLEKQKEFLNIVRIHMKSRMFKN